MRKIPKKLKNHVIILSVIFGMIYSIIVLNLFYKPSDARYILSQRNSITLFNLLTILFSYFIVNIFGNSEINRICKFRQWIVSLIVIWATYILCLLLYCFINPWIWE